jgi:flavorubredoxin
MTDAKPISLTKSVHWVGANDQAIKLFEGLWEIPEGVSFNSYLVQGSEKTALIDSVHELRMAEHLERIRSQVDPSTIDYLVINHMEPDHVSSVPAILENAPNAKVVITPMGQTIFRKYFRMDPSTILVKNEDTHISLGDKTLQFIQTPWLHWPETMTTYVPEEKCLFSCDTFGSFQKLPDNFLLETNKDKMPQHIVNSKKYFASVFNTQREWVLKAQEKFKQLNLQVELLAPSHGPVYNSACAREIMKQWELWSNQTRTKTIAVIYGSMYGMTGKIALAIAKGVEEAGGRPLTFNLSESLAVDALTAIIEAPAIIVGSSTYEHEIFPKVKDFLNMLRTKKFSNRLAAVFGSFSWSGEATRKLAEEMAALGFEMVEKPLSVFGYPTKDDLEKAEQLGKQVSNLAFAKYNIAQQ